MISLNMSAEQVGSAWSNATLEQRREHRGELDRWYRHREHLEAVTASVAATVDDERRPAPVVRLGARSGPRGPMARHRGPEADARAAASKITCTSCGATAAVTASPDGAFDLGYPAHAVSCARQVS